MNALKEGFRRASREPFAIGALFLFHFAWSFFLYRFIERNVEAIMRRYPAPELGDERVDLFLYDFFILIRDKNFAFPLIAMLLAYAIVRLVMAPALDAGVYNSLHEEKAPRGTAFLRGMRRLSISFIWLYALRLFLVALPLYWAVPAGIRAFMSAESPLSLAIRLLPWVAGLAVLGAVLRLLFTYVLFALTEETRLLSALGFALRRFVPVCGIALAVASASAAVSLAVFAASLYWAGFLSVVLYLAYPLFRIWLRIWGIAAQHRYWQVNRT